MKVKLDKLDIMILRVLQAEANLSNKQIGTIVNKSVTTIFARRGKLLRQEYIIRTCAVLNRKLLGLDVVGYLHVKINNPTHALYEEFKLIILQNRAVSECVVFAGEGAQIMMKIVTKDVSSFNKTVNEIAEIPFVKIKHSSIILTELIADRGFDIN